MPTFPNVSSFAVDIIGLILIIINHFSNSQIGSIICQKIASESVSNLVFYKNNFLSARLFRSRTNFEIFSKLTTIQSLHDKECFTSIKIVLLPLFDYFPCSSFNIRLVICVSRITIRSTGAFCVHLSLASR